MKLIGYIPSFAEEFEKIADSHKEAGIKEFARKIPGLGRKAMDVANKKYLDLHSKYPKIMGPVHEAINDPDTMVSVSRAASKLFGH